MKEMAEHKNSKMKVDFPYSPWQRGTNENTNGLIRQSLGTDFNKVSRYKIKKVERLLNEQQTLGFKEPYKVFAEKLAFLH